MANEAFKNKALARFERLPPTREAAWRALAAAERGNSRHYAVDDERLDAVAGELAGGLARGHGNELPPLPGIWNALRSEQPDTLELLARAVQPLDAMERARCGLDLALPSALLDSSGGANDDVLHVCGAFATGLLSFSGASAIDSSGLAAWLPGPLSPTAARKMTALAHALEHDAALFGTPGRFGNVIDRLRVQARKGDLDPAAVRAALLPWVLELQDAAAADGHVEGLGDVWRAPGLSIPQDLAPLHAPLNALLLGSADPLREAGLRLTPEQDLAVPSSRALLDACLTLGLIVPRHATVTRMRHPPGSDIVVELRLLALAIVERLADRLRAKTNRSAGDLPDVRTVVPLLELAAAGGDARARRVNVGDALF